MTTNPEARKREPVFLIGVTVVLPTDRTAPHAEPISQGAHFRTGLTKGFPGT